MHTLRKLAVAGLLALGILSTAGTSALAAGPATTGPCNMLHMMGSQGGTNMMHMAPPAMAQMQAHMTAAGCSMA